MLCYSLFHLAMGRYRKECQPSVILNFQLFLFGPCSTFPGCIKDFFFHKNKTEQNTSPFICLAIAPVEHSGALWQPGLGWVFFSTATIDAVPV